MSKHTFVIRPFRKEFKKYYDNNFKDAWAAVHGFLLRDAEPYRPVTINQKVKDLIKEASFVICDITINSSNVYWELAYAQGLGKPVILLNNTQYQRKKGEKVAVDLTGVEYIRYQWNYNSKNDGFIEQLRTALNQGLKTARRTQGTCIISANAFGSYLNDMKKIGDVFAFLNLKKNTERFLPLLAAINPNRMVFHFEEPQIAKTDLFRYLVQRKSSIYITPLELFADLVVVSADSLLFILRGETICRVQDKQLTIPISKWQEQLLQSSILVESFYTLGELATSLHKISYADIQSLKRDGFAFFDESEYWLERPSILLSKWFDSQRKGKLWEMLQRKINQNFTSFSDEILKKVSFVYAIWPLLKDSESLELAGKPTRFTPRNKQSYWVKKWLKDLDSYAKKSGGSNMVTRFLIVSRNQRYDKYYIRDPYKTQLKTIIDKHFMRCSYQDHVYVIFDDQDVLAKVFGTQYDRDIVCSNCILFCDKRANTGKLNGYLQFEEKIEILNGKTILNLRYINLQEEHRQIEKYLSIFRSFYNALDENKKISENLPCLMKLKDFYDSFLRKS